MNTKGNTFIAVVFVTVIIIVVIWFWFEPSNDRGTPSDSLGSQIFNEVGGSSATDGISEVEVIVNPIDGIYKNPFE